MKEEIRGYSLRNSTAERTFQDRMVSLACAIYHTETLLPNSFVTFCIYSHFALLGLGFCTVQLALNDHFIDIHKIGDSVLYTCTGISFPSIVLFLLVLVKQGHTDSRSVLNQTFLYFTIAYTYVFNPLIVWVAVVEIFHHLALENEFELPQFTCMVFCIITGMIYFAASFLLSRNFLPSGAMLASPNSKLEMAVLLFSYTTLSLSFIETHISSSFTANFVVTATSNLSMLVSLLIVVAKPLFWSEKTSSLYISCYLRVAGLKIFSDAVKLGWTSIMHIPISMVIIVMMGRLGEIIALWQRKINLCDKSTSAASRVFGLFVFLDLLAENKAATKQQIVLEVVDKPQQHLSCLLLHYLGSWARYRGYSILESEMYQEVSIDELLKYLIDIYRSS